MAPYAIRVLSLLFAVIYSLFSFGDSIQAETATVLNPIQNVPLEPESRSINILQSRDEISMYLQQAADMYSEANGGVKISVRTVAGQSGCRIALRAALLSGEKVDIFHIFGYQDMTELLPYLEELSALEWVRDAVPGTLDAVSLGASFYGVPYSIEGAGLIINSQIFEKAGLYTGGINTPEALEELFKTLQDDIFAGNLAEDFPELEAVTEFAAGDKNYIGGLFANIALYGTFTTTSEAAVSPYADMPDSEPAKEFLRIMALYSSCTKWSQLNEVTRTKQIEGGIASGRVAAIFDDTEAYRRIYAANPDMEGHLRLLPIPLETDGSSAKVYAGANVYWAVNAQSPPQAKKEAERFLTWLYRTESGSALLANRMKAISPYRDMAKDTGISLHTQLIRQINEKNSLPMLQNEFPQGWGSDSFAAGVRQYLAKETTWDELIQNSRESWAGLKPVSILGNNY